MAILICACGGVLSESVLFFYQLLKSMQIHQCNVNSLGASLGYPTTKKLIMQQDPDIRTLTRVQVMQIR